MCKNQKKWTILDCRRCNRQWINGATKGSQHLQPKWNKLPLFWWSNLKRQPPFWSKLRILAILSHSFHPEQKWSQTFPGANFLGHTDCSVEGIWVDFNWRKMSISEGLLVMYVNLVTVSFCQNIFWIMLILLSYVDLPYMYTCQIISSLLWHCAQLQLRVHSSPDNVHNVVFRDPNMDSNWYLRGKNKQ